MINKKVLVVSHNSFSKVANNGKTLESIFKYFQKDSLAQVFFSENENPDFEFCDNYFKITDTDVLKSLLKGFSDCGYQLTSELKNIKINDNIKSNNSILFRFAKANASNLVFFRDILWAFKSWKSRSFLNWTSTFKPDVIFFVGGNFGFSHEIACFLSKKYNIPLVSYFTDDYLIYPDSINFLDKIQRKRMKIFYRNTIKHSSLCFTIGQIMAREYTKYFNKEFIPIMNSVKIQDYKNFVPNLNTIYSYFGGLHLGRWQMLIRFANLIPSGVINVYCIDKPTDEIMQQFQKVNIKYKGAIKGDELNNAIKSSDVLLHVESDDKFYRSLTKLSISTKIPEYLISGRPIIGFGPNEVASMKILSENNIGFVISSSLDDNYIKTELNNIISDIELRKKIGKKGYQYAIDNFDIEKIAKDFKDKLENLN